MKKIAIILAVLAASFAVSCNKEEASITTPDPSVPAGMKKVTITATVEAADTKTTYDADGKFSWTAGDKISVMGSDYNFYTLTATQTGASSTFTGMVPEGVNLRKEAFYPADPGHYREGGNYFFSIPRYKDLSESFSADLPMGAYSGTDNYAFNHITGAALFTFTNIPDNVSSVEIAIVNASLKFNGLFGTWVSDGMWKYGVAGVGTASEGEFIRKVPVVDNKAQIYLPYAPDGNIWAECEVSVTGYDAGGNEYALLTAKKMSGFSAFPRATVIPIKPLELPDYLPLSVDWDAEDAVTFVNDAASVDGAKLESMTIVADENYMYVRIVAPLTTPFGATHLDIAFCDGETEGEKVWWGWNTKGNDKYWEEHKGTLNEGGYLTSMQFSHGGSYQNIDCQTVIKDGKVAWYLAYPLSYIDTYRSAADKVFVGGFLWNGYDGYWAVPARNSDMLEVTLP